MTLNIRNPEADHLARQLARIDDTSITDAVIVALREAIRARVGAEAPGEAIHNRPENEAAIETAKRLLAKHGLSFQPGRQPVPQNVYHDMDHDLIGEN